MFRAIRKFQLFPKVKSPFTRTSSSGSFPADKNDNVGSKTNDPTEKIDNVGSKTNIADEYAQVFRSQSYIDLCTKIHDNTQLSTATTAIRSSSELDTLISSSSPSSMPPLANHFSCSTDMLLSSSADLLLEPQQQTLLEIMIRNSSQIHPLLLQYFQGSLEACNLCGCLLQGIHETRANDCIIQRVVNLTKQVPSTSNNLVHHGDDDEDNDQCLVIFEELASFVKLNNPWSSSGRPISFTVVHDQYQLLFNQLIDTRNKIEKRVKLMSIFSTTKWRFLRKRIRAKEQLDAAAKGIYVLKSDIDVIERLVERLHDEIEHRKAIAMLCTRNRQEKVMLKEVVREFQSDEACFLKHIGDLEEHVYLCFLTINRARKHVIQKIIAANYY